MLKSPLSILAVLLCFAIGTAFWLNKTSVPLVTLPRVVASAPSAPPSIQQKPRDSAAYRDRMKDYAEKMDEIYAQAAEFYTPEVQKMASLAAKRQLKKDYGPLFAKWGLEEGKADAALAFIFERDEAIRNAQYKQYSEGRSGKSEFKWSEFEEMHTARFQLELILGTERTLELCRMETDRRMEVMSKAVGVPKAELIKRLNGGRAAAKAPAPPSVFKRD